jgi:DNA-binding LacI/PurR family transcriptional regulator
MAMQDGQMGSSLRGPGPGDPRPVRVATIHDVAKAAQVSITTVSHVFNQPHRVSKSTSAKVVKIATELAYRPNVHARRLVTRKSRSLAIQIAGQQVRHEHALVPNSEYFLELLNGAANSAAEQGYALILAPTDVDPSDLESFAVDGVLLVDPAGDEPIFDHRELLSRIVTVGRPLTALQVFSMVDNDHREAARTLMTGLQRAGYRAPALLVNDMSRSYVNDMVDGYRSWVAKHSCESIVIDVDKAASLAEAVEEMCARGCDAVFASSEYLALDVLHLALDRGMQVPEDLGICSAVDSGILRLASPEISGIYLNPRELGRRAVELLINLVEGSAQPGGFHSVAAEVRWRQSTNRPSQN